MATMLVHTTFFGSTQWYFNLFALCPQRSQKVLPAPMLLTACMGFSRLCLVYERERHILLGMEVPSFSAEQQSEPQQVCNQIQKTTSRHSANIRSGAADCVSQQKSHQAPRFHRGAGLARLYRDREGFAGSESTDATSSGSFSKMRQSLAGRLSDMLSDPEITKTSSAAIIQFSTGKLPHASAPSGLLCYTFVDPCNAASTSQNIGKRSLSVRVISLATDGYVLMWSYKFSYCSPELVGHRPSGNVELAKPVQTKSLHVVGNDQPIQSCCFDKKGNACNSNATCFTDYAQNDNGTIPALQKYPTDPINCIVAPSSGSFCGNGTYEDHTGDIQALGRAACNTTGPAGSRDFSQERA